MAFLRKGQPAFCNILVFPCIKEKEGEGESGALENKSPFLSISHTILYCPSCCAAVAPDDQSANFFHEHSNKVYKEDHRFFLFDLFSF